MGLNNSNFPLPQLQSLRKSKRLIFKLHRDDYAQLKEKMKEHSVKNLQELFDALVISGIVFRNPQALDFAKKHTAEYRAFHNMQKKSFLNGKKISLGKMNSEKYCTLMAILYPHDMKAIKDYLIEENTKQQWVIETLFVKAFIGGEQFAVDLIKRYKNLNIKKRKQKVAKLIHDKYITVLATPEAKLILKQLTEEYDRNEFDEDLNKDLINRTQLDEKYQEALEERLLEDELNDKINQLKKERVDELRSVVAIIEEDE